MVKDNTFPKHYESWAKVPMGEKALILPEVEKYFNIRRWFDGGQNEVWARAGLDWTCKDRYRDAKNTFKNEHFIERGAYENIDFLRENPPPGVDYVKIWLPFMNRMTDPRHISRAQKNSQNRSKQKFASKHGSQSYAMRRDKRREDDPEHKYPSLIDNYREMHTHRRDGSWVSDEACDLHRKMIELRTNSPSGTSEEEIMDEVLGTRSGHNRGRGRKLPISITGGSLMTSSSRQKGKGKMQEENVMTTSDFYQHLQAIQAANPNFVIPNFPINNQNEDENEEDNEDNDDDDF